MANFNYLVHWSYKFDTQFYPDRFTLELLDPNLNPLLPQPIYNNSNAFFPDPSMNKLNCTNWLVPANATNGRYRLRWTGLFSGGIQTSQPPVAVSDVFTVGPVFPGDPNK
jgi:hypothetical protein